LQIESKGRNSTKGYGHGKSKDHKRSKSKNHRSSHNSKTIECWNYGKIGHYKNQCKIASKNQEVEAEANVISTLGGYDTLICSLESKEES